MLKEDHNSSVAEAFSRKALVYDAFGEDHPNLSRMRQKVRLHTLTNLCPGDRILELNAGTGADAAYFAALGFQVHATDLSPGMVAAIEQKRTSLGLQGRLSVQLCSFESLDQLGGRSFDYVFSNMGGVNCTVNLKQVACGVDHILTTGGRVTWVVMSPICLWELAQIFRGDFSTATRRLHPRGSLAHVEGMHFMTWYYPPRQVISAFGKGYHLLRMEGLSVFTPPADHKSFPIHHPRMYRWLRRMDDLLADRNPFNRWGDFYIITLEKSRRFIPDAGG
jgi:ubiquinone/menaquinone biosynthesis C-methylase UbiE